MAAGEFCEQCKIRCRLEPQRRDGHESGQRQRRFAYGCDELGDLLDRTAALLFLLADVHLDIDARRPRFPAGLFDECVEQGPAIERVDRIE